MWSGSASASPSGDMNGATTTAGGKTRSHRRPRVALACQRCKARKQKCDGKKPTCSNCSSFQIICEYVEPPKPLSQSRGEYYKAAEERVAELEEILSKAGIEDAGQTQWREIQSAQKAGNDHSSSYHPFKRPRDEPPGVEDGRDGSSTRRRLSFDVAEILRDLSLNASGGYIGASSSFTLSRLVASLVRKIDRSDADGTNYAQENQLSTKSFVEKTVGAEQYLQLRSVPEDVADKLLRGYGIHLSTHWPILHSTHIRSLHSRRSSLRSSYEKSILHLVYAIGGRFLECTGEMGAFQCQQHHRAAMQYLDEVIQYHDLRSIQMLILLGIYSLRDPKGPGAWTYIGLAMRTCVDLGMHRRDRGGTESLLEAEMRKRVFWTAYSLDRQNSIMLGRPFAISDRDIDAELPVDVNESIQDETSLRKALEASRSRCEGDAPKTSTSLSPFVHIIRLRQIESQIQQTIYRVDRPTVPSVAQVEKFIGILEDWKERIPRDARHHSANSPTETTDTNFIPGYAYYVKSLSFLSRSQCPC